MLITLSEIKQISLNGVWKQNSSLVQILGMCPLLAITTTLVNGVMLSFATLLVMAFSNFFVACLRNLIPYEIRIPVFILVAAFVVTVIDLGRRGNGNIGLWAHDHRCSLEISVISHRLPLQCFEFHFVPTI